MRIGRRFAMAAVIAASAVLATPSLASAALAISVPPTANLGSVPSGASSLSHQLGPVTVTASGLVAPSFTASVSATVFKTGAGGANETVGKASILYWSGTATSFTGILGGGTAGQATAAQAQNLSVTRTAFSGTGLLLSISAAWNPTVIVNIPASAVVGTYSGTITHSVA